jgi:hypothetical protein
MKSPTQETINKQPQQSKKPNTLKIIGITIISAMIAMAIHECVEKQLLKNRPSKQQKNAPKEKKEPKESPPRNKEIQEGIYKGTMRYA